MSVSLAPPKRKTPSEADIEAVINKGGKPTIEDTGETVVKHFNIRLTSNILEQIDKHRAVRPRKPGSPKLGVSIHDWLVEAVLEKLERENNKIQV